MLMTSGYLKKYTHLTVTVPVALLLAQAHSRQFSRHYKTEYISAVIHDQECQNKYLIFISHASNKSFHFFPIKL